MTAAYRLIGGDVANSPSPAMMNAAFGALGIDAVYSAQSVKSQLLPETFNSLKADGVLGGNITIPHKSAVLPLLDGCDEVSARVKAVNAIIREEAGFTGFNTDVHGIVASLAEHGLTNARKALVIGAGGASRAFCEAANSLGCHSVAVIVRDRARAYRFFLDMRTAFPGIDITLQSPTEEVRLDADLVFNASPAGTSGSRVPGNVMAALKPEMVVFDAVYRPVDTDLLLKASRLGCITIRGHEMLLNQATAAFERWTGRPAPKELMRARLLRELGVGL